MALKNQREFRNLVLLRWGRLETATRFGKYVDGSIERVLKHIRTPLGE